MSSYRDDMEPGLHPIMAQALQYLKMTHAADVANQRLVEAERARAELVQELKETQTALDQERAGR